jgi:hypothetical protein
LSVDHVTWDFQLLLDLPFRFSQRKILGGVSVALHSGFFVLKTLEAKTSCVEYE